MMHGGCDAPGGYAGAAGGRGGFQGAGAGFGGAGGAGGAMGGAGFGGASGGHGYHSAGAGPGGAGFQTGGFQTGGYQAGGYQAGGYQAGGYQAGGYQALGALPAGAAGADVGCAATTCASAGCMAIGESSISMVGPGQGEYVVETTYRYVGAGRGDLLVTAPRTVLWGRILGLLALLGVGGVLAFMMMPQPTSTTSLMQSLGPLESLEPAPLETTEPPTEPPTTTTTEAPTGECTSWGDPHSKSFDGARPSFYGDGEYYIVTSDTVTIQGRYEGTKYTAGLAAANKVAVGGAFLDGHVITVPCMEGGDIEVDGVPVLTTFPSTYHVPGGGMITYSEEGKLVDGATDQWEKRIVNMHLPKGVHFQVFRWSNYLDFRLIMQRQPNQDGTCGNFNGDPADDTTQAIYKRIGDRVPKGKLLFNDRAPVEFTETEKKLLELCDAKILTEAKAQCGKMLEDRDDDSTRDMSSCMLDMCFGANEHVLKMAKNLGLVDEEELHD